MKGKPSFILFVNYSYVHVEMWIRRPVCTNFKFVRDSSPLTVRATS